MDTDKNLAMCRIGKLRNQLAILSEEKQCGHKKKKKF